MAYEIADTPEVLLDYLVGDGFVSDFDKKTLARFQELLQLDEAKRNTLFGLIDTYIRDAKVRRAHG